MLGTRIALLRIARGWSQAELAKKIGVSASAVGMYEQGRREPSLGLIVCLAREFGVTTDYLLMGVDAIKEVVAKQKIISERDDHTDKLIECLLHVVAHARLGVVKDRGGD